MLFDFPGQVELFTHHKSAKAVAQRLCKELDFRVRRGLWRLCPLYLCNMPCLPAPIPAVQPRPQAYDA